MISNAETYGVDEQKIALGGVSGGGFTVMIAAMLLARNQEQSLVKKLILVAPMLGRNLEDTPKEQVPKWERSYIWCQPWHLLVDDFETMDKNRDPILYPFHISDEEAKLLP